MSASAARTPGRDQRAAARRPDDVVPDPRRWLALAVASVATLMVVLDVSVVNIALPQAQRDLGMSVANRQWTVTAYALAFGGLLLWGGRIADLLGRKRMLTVALIGFAAASALGGLAPTPGALFAARAAQGAFAALLAPAALALVAVAFTDPRERARAFGVYGAFQGGGGAAGLLLGGVLTQYAGWRWCMYVNLPLALAVAVAARFAVTESRAPGPRRFDVPGTLLVTGGLAALVYGLAEAAGGGGWTAPGTLALLAGAVVLLGGFALVERRAAHPLLPPRVVLDRDRAGVLLGSLLIGAGMFGMNLFLTFYLQADLGYGPLAAGCAFLPFSAGIVATTSLGPPLVARLGTRILLTGGLVVAALGLLWLTRLDAGSGYAAGVLPAQLLVSTGVGLFLLAGPNVVLSSVAPRDAGVASAALNAAQQVGAALGPALLSTLYLAAVAGHGAAGAVPGGGDGAAGAAADALAQAGRLHGYRVAFLAAAVLFGLALALVALLVRRPRTAAGPGGGTPAGEHAPTA